ncbi:MAG: hypothetical protein IJ099_06895 [Alphaproteobacteria bacterium]|nr:hypothetical protein [Alphaproteobacteria bacterium]
MRKLLYLYQPNISVLAMVGLSANNRPLLSGTVIISEKGLIYSVFLEIDSDGRSIYKDEIDPDDLTDYGYWRRKKTKKSWSPPGYGDDD